MEFKEIDILLQMHSLITEREGMVAENMARYYLHEPPAYYDDAFQKLQGKFEELRSILRK